MRVAVHVDEADHAGVLVQDGDLVGLLHDAERIRHVGETRHARQNALVLRIERLAVLEVLLLLRERLGAVGNLVPLDHATACGNTEARAVILQVPGGGVQHLPDALQVGLPLARAGWRVGSRGGLRRAWSRREHEGRSGWENERRPDVRTIQWHILLNELVEYTPFGRIPPSTPAAWAGGSARGRCTAAGISASA